MKRLGRYCWLGLFIGLFGGCAALVPSGRPPISSLHIDGLRLEPSRTTAGCPVALSLNFDGASGHSGRLWVVSRVRRSTMAPDLVPLVLMLGPGEIGGSRGSLTSVVRPRRYGVNWIHVQLEDAAGHPSNTLKAPVLVDAPVPWRPTHCPYTRSR